MRGKQMTRSKQMMSEWRVLRRRPLGISRAHAIIQLASVARGMYITWSVWKYATATLQKMLSRNRIVP
jgi:hypothetical protein